MRVRGLKLVDLEKGRLLHLSHSCGCVVKRFWERNLIMVASHAGAWIETVITLYLSLCTRLHPMRVRGLKHKIEVLIRKPDNVAPHAGAWIETRYNYRTIYRLMSHPMLVLGLKRLHDCALGYD